MDEERELGRVRGLESKRAAILNRVRRLTPIVHRARHDMRNREIDDANMSAMARWLTAAGIETPRFDDGDEPTGSVWKSETVKRLYNFHVGQRDQAKRIKLEFLEIAKWSPHYAKPEIKAKIEADMPQRVAEIEADYQAKLIEIDKLREALNPHHIDPEPHDKRRPKLSKRSEQFRLNL
jgi:hypothetical protein